MRDQVSAGVRAASLTVGFMMVSYSIGVNRFRHLSATTVVGPLDR